MGLRTDLMTRVELRAGGANPDLASVRFDFNVEWIA
jgi:hypothetical protein